MQLEYSFKSTDSASFLDAARQLMETKEDFDSVFDITFCNSLFRSKIPVYKAKTTKQSKRRLSKSKIPRLKKATVTKENDYERLGRMLGNDAKEFIKELAVTENFDLIVEVDKKIRTRKVIITATNK